MRYPTGTIIYCAASRFEPGTSRLKVRVVLSTEVRQLLSYYRDTDEKWRRPNLLTNREWVVSIDWKHCNRVIGWSLDHSRLTRGPHAAPIPVNWLFSTNGSILSPFFSSPAYLHLQHQLNIFGQKETVARDGINIFFLLYFFIEFRYHSQHNTCHRPKRRRNIDPNLWQHLFRFHCQL